MFIPIIIGTGRSERRSIRAAKFLEKFLRKHGIDTEIIDPVEFKLCITTTDKDNRIVKKFRNLIVKADALILVVPEYNHFFPGELKLLMDSLYEEYDKKPVAVCGVAYGSHGGLRAIDMTKLYAITLGMIPIRTTILFGNIDDLVDEEGNVHDEKFEKRALKMLRELIWYAKAIKYAKENIRVDL